MEPTLRCSRPPSRENSVVLSQEATATSVALLS